jgi:predicted Zn-dependent peptidase
MKPFFSLILLVCLIWTDASGLAAQTLSQTPEMAGVRLPDYRTLRLDNGLTLLLMERHQLPLVSFRWRLQSAGAIGDPDGREGLAMLTARLLRKGTQSRSAEQIAAAVDFVGGSLDAGTAQEYAFGTAEFLKKDLDLAVDLFSDTLIHPSFPAEELNKMIKQEVDGIKDDKTVPGQVIERYYEAFLFGAHPYGRIPGGTETTLPRITREQVLDFHAKHYMPNQLVLAVVGDFSTPALEAALRERFGSWKAKLVSTPEVTAAPRVKESRALIVEKPDATQTFFRFGDVALSRTNKDWVTVQAVNSLFGGRFTSMINTELRIESGLTYHANSYFQARRLPGSFAIAAYTQNEATGRALDMALAVLKRLHEKGLTPEQLQSIKTYLKGQFGPTLQTNDQLVEILCELQFYGLGPDYINAYFQRIDAITIADANRVIAKYFPLDNLAFVLIGQGSVIEPVAKKLAGQVTRKPINAPGF